MPDIEHMFGADFTLSPTGGLAVAAGPQLGLERVLRRLMTNAGDYIFAPQYGAGLPASIGRPLAAARMKALIFAQMMQESRVARSPPPVVTVTSSHDGTTYAFVRYADALTGQTQTLNLPVV